MIGFLLTCFVFMVDVAKNEGKVLLALVSLFKEGAKLLEAARSKKKEDKEE